MLVVTTLAPPNGRREGRKDEQTKNARCHNSSPTYDRRKGRKDEQRAKQQEKWSQGQMTNEYSNMSKPFRERNSVLFTKTYSTVRQVKVRKFLHDQVVDCLPLYAKRKSKIHC